MTKTEHEAMDIMKLFCNILLGGALALAVCCGLLFIASAAISVGWLKEEMIGQITVAGCAIGTASGTVFALCRSKGRAVLIGLCVAVVFFLLLLTIGVLIYEDMSLDQGGIALLCGSLCGGGIVGLLGGRPKKKRRRT